MYSDKMIKDEEREEEEEEEQFITCDVSPNDLELLNIVKQNPGLWNNSLKIYSKVEDKNLAWSIIGQNLSSPLSGSDAQKKFLNWRSTFGRLYKKVSRSQPKSGSSSDHNIFIPSWPLYNELLFLKDVIKPRSTKSNFVKSTCIPKNISVPKKSSSIQINLNKSTFTPILKESQNYIVNTPRKLNELTSFDDSSTFVDSQFESLSESRSESSTCNNSFYESQIDVSDAGFVKFAVSKPEPEPLPQPQPRKKIKIETPSTDSFYNKKKLKENEDLKVLKDMADSVRTMTATLTTNTSKRDMNKNSCSGLAETLNPEIEAFLQVLKSSLERIVPTSRLTCLIELLSIMQKYEQA